MSQGKDALASTSATKTKCLHRPIWQPSKKDSIWSAIFRDHRALRSVAERHDSMLLLGSYRYGVGNWDAIRNDAELGFGTDEEKIIKARLPI